MTAILKFWPRLAPSTRGRFWLLLYCAFFASADATAKFLGQEMNLFQILLIRYVLSLFLIMPVVLHLGIGCLATRRPVLHGVRSTLSFIAQMLIYYALFHMYVADVTAIGFARPLFVTLLAVLVLSERVHWRRWAATAVGFVGVLIMVRPGEFGIGLPALAAVLGTFSFGLALILVRRYAFSELPIKFVFYYHLAGVVLSAIPAILYWRTPTAEELALLVLIAILSTAAQTCGILAYSVAEASVVGPMEYFRLLFAAAVGYAVFLEVPGPGTWIGAAVIVGSAIYIARHEAGRRNSATRSVSG